MIKNATDLAPVTLDDKYDLTQQRVFISGSQAIVRLTLLQRERDKLAGLNTAGYVIGYRGSPLGGIDQQFWKAKKRLAQSDVIFQEGLNEDLAATALWGTQQVTIRGEGKVDGVFGVWYGKGPGVDRSGDVFRHANHFGTHKYGGVLALMGDDHTMESSTVAHASEYAFMDASTPVFNPAGLQEILDYGLMGFAMSRFSGLWSALKCVKDTVESTGSVYSDPSRLQIILPEFEMPLGGLNIRAGDNVYAHEERLFMYKLPAALAFIQANKLNTIVLSGGRKPRLGIITTGKSYLDVRQALDDLGLDEVKANDFGIRVMKIGVPWPLVPDDVKEFARGLEKIIVVEEKRALIETQLRDSLYGMMNSPVVVGKKDEQGAWLFPVQNALDANDIAIAIGERVLEKTFSEHLKAKVEHIKQAQTRLKAIVPMAMRMPYFCSGCPHNSSTILPEGSRGYAGIGCHFMSQWMDRKTEGFTHMGGEGANWVGEAPFSKRDHMFQNLGDGTYNHSGSLAIRFSVGAGVNVTYKILFNDAVAMTGGQAHDGGVLTVDKIAQQVAGEGVKVIRIVTDEPDKYPHSVRFPEGVTLHGREQLNAVQTELRDVKGVSVLIYDQTCAAEKRRRRKKGTFPDPPKRVIINELVCEGCGDCGVQSNCVSIQPKETEFGRKRHIDQSSCNKDFSCVKGFCPSFVTVHNAELKKPQYDALETEVLQLPDPLLPSYGQTYNIIVTGIGGTGIVTVGALLGMAAHLEGKGCGIIDMAGLAQKGGEVFSHVRIARRPEDIHAIRINAGTADVIFGGEIVVAGSKKVLAAINPSMTKMVVNSAEILPGDFTRNIDFSLPSLRLTKAISETAGENNLSLYDFQALALKLTGNAIASNLMMMGFAYQKGFIPLSEAALVKAIELNGEAVALNLRAFTLGRQLAHDPVSLTSLIAPKVAAVKSIEARLEERAAFLRDYQNQAYADKFMAVLAPLKGQDALYETAFISLFKLMAIKDEYEVARLYTNGAFEAQVANTFSGEKLRYSFHLSPPLFAKKDVLTGVPKKYEFGAWMMPVFKVLSHMKALRGGMFDFFGRSHERITERRLRDDYICLIGEILQDLTPHNHAIALEILKLPVKIRGFGHVKEKAIVSYEAELKVLREQFYKGDLKLAAE